MTMRHQAHKQDRLTETLVLRGMLRGDHHFIPLGCYSTRIAGAGKMLARGDYFLELLDNEKRLLLREPADAADPVACVNFSPDGILVEGRMPLHPDGKELRLLKGGTLIQTFPIGSAPELKVKWKTKKVDRKKNYPLMLQFSEPTPDAYIKIFYQWDENRYRTVALTPPVKDLQLQFGSLPGGDRCHLIVTYTSGMRTVVETSDAFSVPLLGPTLRIVRPREKSVFAPWHPITLEAEVVDSQKIDADELDLVWMLNGKAVCKGRLGCLQSLAEGKYELEVSLYGQEAMTARKNFEVSRPKTVAGIPAMDWD